jgi:aspartate aminotransferase
MKLSSRMDSVGESATIAVTRRARELAEKGIDVVDFGPGEPDFASDPVASRAARAAIEQGHTGYTLASGPLDLRKGLAERYARDFGAPWQGAADTLVTVGGKGALFQFALAALDAGDELLIPKPCWVSFAEQCRLAGASPAFVPMPRSEDGGFRFDVDRMMQSMGPATRAVILNAPCNPSGAVLSAADFERLAEHCAERSVLLVCDEAYEMFVYDGGIPVSGATLAARYPETILLVGTFSKSFAMTGWRVGYALGPTPLIAAMTTIQGHAVTHPATFAMIGAAAALQHRGTEQGQASARTIVERFERRRNRMVERLNSLPGVTCGRPAGAFYAFADISEHCGPAREFEDSVAFASAMLDRAAVAVVPGTAFGVDGFARFSFAVADERIEQGMDRLELALSGRDVSRMGASMPTVQAGDLGGKSR